MFWARGGGATRRETIPAAAPRRTSPELTNSSAPGIVSTKVWVRGARRGTLNPPEHSYGLGWCLVTRSARVAADLRAEGRRRVVLRWSRAALAPFFGQGAWVGCGDHLCGL